MIAAPTGNRPKPTMRAVVCGSATCRDRAMVEHVLTILARQFGITSIAHEGRSGVDTIAHLWAREQNIGVRSFPSQHEAARRDADGRLIRDFLPDLVIAFPGDARSAALVARARAAGVHVLDITADGEVCTSPSLDQEASHA